MSQQTTYTTNMGKPFAGVLADIRPIEVDSKVLEGADAKFGVFVVRGTNDGQAKLPSASTDKVLGPVIAHQGGKTLNLGAVDIVIEATEPMSILRTGNIYVQTEDACTAGGGVFVRYASGAGGTQLGAVRASAVTDETIDLSSEWEFEESGDAGAFVKIRKK